MRLSMGNRFLSSCRKKKKAGMQVARPGRNITSRVLVPALAILFSVHVFAAGDGSAGIVQATQMVTGYFDPATKLIYAAGALCGLIGAIRVYSKFSSGDPDTGKTAGSWFGACVFLIVAATVLRSFFL